MTEKQILKNKLTIFRRKPMMISDLDYLYSIPETDAMYLNGGQAASNGTGFAIAEGSSTYTSIVFRNRTNPFSAFSSVLSTARSSGGIAIASASSSSFVSPSR
jgi:hypothetical protein